MYSCTTNENGELSEVRKFSKKINSKLNESTAIFTKDGKTVYFTSNNLLEGKMIRNENNEILLKIFSATLNDKGEWDNVQELPFNSDTYNCAHPALSLDEKVLYFASNMPGSLGESDLFKVDILGNNQFSTPKNLGSKINTAGRETFPFVSLKNELYFASNGHLGFGGMDVFGTKIKGDNSYSKVYNLGKPLNTNQDDFAYVINSETALGYVSSNRNGGKGLDDIYKFSETKKLPFDCEHVLSGNVMDIESKKIIPNENIVLLDKDLQVIKSGKTDSSGAFSFNVNCDTQYYIRATAEKYISNEIPVETPYESGVTKTNIELKKRFVKIEENLDLAKVYGIENIYFGFDKYNITRVAEEKLIVLLSVLEQYPQIKINIGSHTDSRGNKDYNLNLSDKRAQSTMQYLISKGISPDRLSARGYGENQPVNHCTDGVRCSEEEHQKNRRSEFVILKK